jgi:hypothetical protein
VAIGIDVHGEGGANINALPVNTTDIRVLVRSLAGGNPADGNHIGIAGKTGIADIDIVASDIWIGTRSSAEGGIEIASAILKCQVTHRSVVALANAVLQRGIAKGVIEGSSLVGVSEKLPTALLKDPDR